MTENETSDEHDPAEERCQIELGSSPSIGGTERVTGDLLEREAEALVTIFNDAAPDYSPELEWFAMSHDHETGEQQFVLEAEGYIDGDGLSALRDSGRVVQYIEAYQKPPSDDVHCQIEIPVCGDGGRSLSPGTDRDGGD